MTTLDLRLLCVAAALVLAAHAPAGVHASSHMEAPLISMDRFADNTDVYAFVSPDDAGRVTLIANYIPLLEPGDGPNYHRFEDNVRYEIHIDNNGDCLEDITYRFTFQTVVADPGTYLYQMGPIGAGLTNRNVRQTYTVTRADSVGSTDIASGVAISPHNIGPRSNGDIEQDMLNSVATVGDTKVFAGPVDDAFYLDQGAIFDLLNLRDPPGDPGTGVDTFAGFNAMAIALEIPVEALTANGTLPSGPTDPNAILGIWSTASRRKITIRNLNGTSTNQGAFVQVSRLAMPLINEILNTIDDRDERNRTHPSTDASSSDTFLRFSDVPSILGSNLGVSTPFPPRDDIRNFFYHDLKTPAGCVGDVLRLNVAIPPSMNPDPLGALAGDAAGFPNGRRPGDDVVDVVVSVLLVTHPGDFGDGVDYNDKPFLDEFPFLAPPHGGVGHGAHVP